MASTICSCASASTCRRLIVHYHYASLICNSTRPQHTLQSTYSLFKSLGLNHYLDSLGSMGLLQPTLGNPSLSNSHPHKVCNFPTTQLDSNTDDQYSLLKWFKVWDLTNWANENLTALTLSMHILSSSLLVHAPRHYPSYSQQLWAGSYPLCLPSLPYCKLT